MLMLPVAVEAEEAAEAGGEADALVVLLLLEAGHSAMPTPGRRVLPVLAPLLLVSAPELEEVGGEATGLELLGEWLRLRRPGRAEPGPADWA